MSNVYAGDEVNALVVDMGTHSCKAGYAGDDAPKAVFPSMVGVHAAGANGMGVEGKRKLSVGYQALSAKQLAMEVQSPFGPDDLTADWELMEELYGHAMRDRLGVKPEEFALLLAEPTHNTRASRERLAELVFEGFQAPALYLAKSAVLSAFATARQTALVVDAGYRACTAAAVQDGYVLQKTVTRTPVAGQLLNHVAQSVAEAKYTPLRPRFAVRRQEVKPGEFQTIPQDTTGITNSYRMYHVEQVAAEMKESVCRVSDTRYSEADSGPMPTAVYELPDGQELFLGSERVKMGEVFFQPGLVNTFAGLTAPPNARSLQEVVLETINKCDVDVRKDMFSSAILTGGTSLVPGLRERLEKELSELVPPAAKVKIVAPVNAVERRFSVWIGGSILATLGTFQQLWMSKKEYGEHGAPLINRKCP